MAALSNVKRERIIEAALTLFAEQGFHGTNVPAIAKLANVGTGTIYRYFENKEELVNTVYQIYMNKLLELITKDFPTEASTYEQYLFIMKQLTSFAKRYKKAFIFIETHNHANYLNESSNSLINTLEIFLCTFINKGVEAGELKENLSCEVLIAIVYGAFVAIFKRIEAGAIKGTVQLMEAFFQSGWDAIKRK